MFYLEEDDHEIDVGDLDMKIMVLSRHKASHPLCLRHTSLDQLFALSVSTERTNCGHILSFVLCTEPALLMKTFPETQPRAGLHLQKIAQPFPLPPSSHHMAL